MQRAIQTITRKPTVVNLVLRVSGPSFTIATIVTLVAASAIGCDEGSSQQETDAHLADQSFRAANETASPTCHVRGERAFAACDDCTVACVEFGPDATPPQGLYLNQEWAADRVILRAGDGTIALDERRVADLKEGRVDPSHKGGGAPGLRIEPLLEELDELRELREREASQREDSFEPRALLLAEPAYPSRLLVELVYTALAAGFEFSVPDPAQGRTNVELACDVREGNEHLYETDWLGRPVEVDFLGDQRQITWLCRPEARASDGAELQRTTVEFWTPSDQLLGSLSDPAKAALTVEIGEDGFYVTDLSEAPRGVLMPPVEGCPDEGPTICLRDGDRETTELFEAALEAASDGPGAPSNRALDDALKRYDFERLSELLADWQRENEGTHASVTSNRDVPIAVTQRTIQAMREHHGDAENRELFETISLATMQ